MTGNGFTQFILYFIVLIAAAKPLGLYMARVYEGKACGLDWLFGGLEERFIGSRRSTPSTR